MTIQRVTCPNCRTDANIPTGMASVRCNSCGSIWNPNDSVQDQVPTNEDLAASSQKAKSGSANKIGLIIGGIAGGLACLAIAFLAVQFIMQPEPIAAPAPSPAATPSVATAAQVNATVPTEPFREINLPEPTRQQIYRDYRKAAGSTVDKQILIPKDSAVRSALDNTLGQTLDRELTHFSLIHNITVDDVKEIIKEGSAKQWK